MTEPEAAIDVEEVSPGSRQIWTGTVSFGLVSIPVSLIPGVRSEAVSLRMLSPEGTPLSRRYVCSKDGRRLEADDLIRGYETGGGDVVVVTDEELASLAPEASRDIDLRRFVDLREIDPVLFDRPYYLVPASGSSKAYRLLAETMEKADQAGIATFVMRGREYLVAIVAHEGRLRAETLRFADEVRRADSVGLPEKPKVDRRSVVALEKSIAKMTKKGLDPASLIDDRNRRLLERIASKDEQGQDVISTGILAEPGDESVVNLMEKLKESLRGRGAEREPKRHRGSGRRGGGRRAA